MHFLIVATFPSDKRSPLTASKRIRYLNSEKSKTTVQWIKQQLHKFCFKQAHRINKDCILDPFLVPRLAFKSLLDEDGEVMAKRSVAVEPKDQVNWSIQSTPYLNVEQDIVPIIVNATTEVI